MDSDILRRRTKMSSIGRILFLGSKILLYGVILACAYGFASDKYYAHTLPQEKVVKRCSGYLTMDSVCDCYNYYGRKCLSSKMLGWDWTPQDEEDTETETPFDFDEELYTEGEEQGEV